MTEEVVENKIKCASADCETVIDTDADSYWVSPFGEQKTFCDACFESDLQYPSRLWRFGAEGDAQYVNFGDEFAIDENGEIPAWFESLIPDDWAGRLYVRDDGWRGHFETAKILNGVSLIENGWTTGFTEDAVVAHKAVFNEQLENWVKRESVPVTLFVLLEPTSNVFSMGVDVFCHADDESRAKEFLNELFGEDGLRTALG